MQDSILKAIVCGFENGGTTLLRNILRQHSRLDSGFEGGFLMARTPRDFLDERFSSYNQSQIRNGWGITDEELREYICQVDTWNSLYLRLREKAQCISNKSVSLFDKTPRYMQCLNDVLLRASGVPAIVIKRDPRAVLWSWIKRSPELLPENLPLEALENMCARYRSYAKGCRAAEKNHPERILLLNYEELCGDPKPYIRKMFDFVGVEFDNSMLKFEASYGVWGERVSIDYTREYERHLPSGVTDTILMLTETTFS